MLLTAYHSLLLAALLGFFVWRTIRDKSEVRAFKAVTESRDRQRGFLDMTWKSFLMFGVGGIALLVMIGRVDALWQIPAEFTADASSNAGQSFEPTLSRLTGLLTGMTVGALTIFVVWRFVLRRKTQPVVGNVGFLFPRNRAEALTLIPLSINAGVSEEIMFRLALPLLAMQVTGSATAGFAIAAATFGLMHWYQGWIGVILTGLLSYLFISLYVHSGTLLVPIIVHAAIDLMALVIRPSIGLWLDRAPAMTGKA